jgi:hypothetical protein
VLGEARRGELEGGPEIYVEGIWSGAWTAGFFRGDDQMRRLDEARRSRGHRRGVRVGGGERYGRRSSSHFPPLTRSRGVRARWDPCLILRHRGAGGLDLDRQPVDRWETSFRFSGFLGVSPLILVAVKYSGNSARIYWQLARIRTEVKDSLS